jgi:hypothetical protein
MPSQWEVVYLCDPLEWTTECAHGSVNEHGMWWYGRHCAPSREVVDSFRGGRAVGRDLRRTKARGLYFTGLVGGVGLSRL